MKTHTPLTQVFETKDYGTFKILHGNRNLELPHLNRLKESMKSKHLLCPLIVNKWYEIIDGQNRYTVAKELGLPIHYIMVNDYGLTEVQILNSNNKTWNKANFLDSYCKQGLRPYLLFKQFMDTFPELSIGVCGQIIADNSAHVVKKNGFVTKDFETGKLVIKDIEKSIKTAKKILEFKPYYKGFGRRSFVGAIITLMKHKNYNHDVLIGKLKKHAILKIQDMPSSEAYIMQLEDFYNYKNKNKVTLKYNG